VWAGGEAGQIYRIDTNTKAAGGERANVAALPPVVMTGIAGYGQVGWAVPVGKPVEV
jgi:hypothetical protein